MSGHKLTPEHQSHACVASAAYLAGYASQILEHLDSRQVAIGRRNAMDDLLDKRVRSRVLSVTDVEHVLAKCASVGLTVETCQ